MAVGVEFGTEVGRTETNLRGVQLGRQTLFGRPTGDGPKAKVSWQTPVWGAAEAVET